MHPLHSSVFGQSMVRWGGKQADKSGRMYAADQYGRECSARRGTGQRRRGPTSPVSPLIYANTDHVWIPRSRSFWILRSRSHMDPEILF